MRIALGFRAHSGWAAMVAVAGTLKAPQVRDRRRMIIADPHLPGSKQPYHAAAELPFPMAEASLRKALESSRALALDEISTSIEHLRSQGHEVVACGLLLGSGKPLPSLQAILASHPLLHTAEGQMFRDVLSWAARACNLPVTAVPEKQLPPASLSAIDSLGKTIGPPWTQDQKYATLAALTALDALDNVQVLMV
jgi:hypothetical protein